MSPFPNHPVRQTSLKESLGWGKSHELVPNVILLRYLRELKVDEMVKEATSYHVSAVPQLAPPTERSPQL